MQSNPTDSSRRYQRSLLRGTLVNALGLVAKLINPLFFVVVTWLLGPAATGLYLTVIFLTDILSSASISGYTDAITIWGSRSLGGTQADPDALPEAEEFYRVLAAALRRSMALSVSLGLGLALSADWVTSHVFDNMQGLATGLRLSGLALPFWGVATLATAATKAQMKMHHEVAIAHVGRPLGMLASALLAGLLDAGLPGLMLGYLLTHVALAALSVLVASRTIHLRRVLAELRAGGTHRSMHRFAFSQSVNLTFGKYQSRLDAIALGALGAGAELVAFYGTGALLTSNLREIKLVFSSALAPVAARMHGEGDRAGLALLLSRVSRWTASLAVPAILTVLVFRGDILRLIDPSYTADSRFIALMLIPPYLGCSFGIAGNCLVYTGHSGFNLINSVALAVINTALNFLLIPRFGVLGAATASTLSGVVQSIAQMVELQLLEGIHFRLREVFTPHLGLGAALAVVVCWGDPAALPGVGARAGAWLVLLGAYLATLVLAGHPELRHWLRRPLSAVAD